VSETETRPAEARHPAPFLRVEEAPAPRLEPVAPIALPEPRLRPRLPLTLIGATVLVVGLPALWAAGFVADQFARGAALGWFTLAIAVLGFGLVGGAILRELRGLFRIATVDHLRDALASGDPARVRAAARRWARLVPEAGAVLPALDAVADPAAMLALLQAGPGAALRARADALGRNAALQAGAIIAATPSPALDGLAVGWRGLRLVRQVAALHGLRPGLLGTLALLRRTALAAAGVAATELAVNAAAHALLSNKLLQHVLGDVAGAGVAARRLVVLARAVGIACSPLAPE